MDTLALDKNERQRQYRVLTKNACTKKYEKTKKGKLVRTYRNMESRVLGIVSAKAHLYEGLSILPREVFYEWSINDPEFNALHDAWVKSDYSLKLSPSIDRVDVSKGYTMGNIRWITHSENSSLGAKRRHKVE